MFRIKRRMLALAFLIVVSFIYGCYRIANWSNDHVASYVVPLETADRLVIRSTYREKFERETRQPDARTAVLDLVHRYPKGWKPLMSGVGGDYHFYFYRGGELLGYVTLAPGDKTTPGEDTVFVGGALRDVPTEDVTRLTTKLGLNWPTR